MNDSENKKMQYNLKVIFIGEPGVGKTSIVKRYVSNLFVKDYRASIGTNIYVKKIYLNNKEISINIYDIAGQEQWETMRHKYYRGTQGVFIVGDVSRKISFEKIVNFWIKDLRKFCPDIPIILIGNKNDLKFDINMKEIERIKAEINAEELLFTSAKTGKNIERAFKIISEVITQK